MMRNGFAGLFALIAVLHAPLDACAEKLSIKSDPITQFHTASDQNQFGRLTFVGGLILTSKHEEFGGISALRFIEDQNFIAVTDKARVITGTLQRKDGKPSSIKDERITRIKAASGKTITGANDKDAEAVETVGNQFIVGFERNDRVQRFTMRGRKLVADDSFALDLNPFEFPNNKGPEAIAWDPETEKLFVFAEYALNEDGNHRGFIVSDGTIEREISVKQHNGYSLTDAAFLPNGDLLFLERYYNPFLGAFMRLRQVERDTLYNGQPIDGELIAEFNQDYEIDNQEALAVSAIDDETARLTIVSDDNFSETQRTLWLEFILKN